MLLTGKESGLHRGRAWILTHRRITSSILVLMVIMATSIAFLTPGVGRTFAASGPSLAIDVQSGRHAISEDIYGMNLYALDESLASELQLPVERWGGNNTSRYNWQVDSSNPGDNYFYMGGGDGVYMGGSNAGTGNGVPGAAVDRFITSAHTRGAKAMITAPIIPYINKTSALNCSYPSSLYPPQQRYSTETLPNGDTCGNGHDLNGNHITDTNIELNNTPNSTDSLRAWTQHLVETHGTTANGGVNFYEMDNEPSLWYLTHHDIHPEYTGYDELVNLTQSYAEVIKQVDPSAVITGPSDFGWWGYVGGQTPAGDGGAEHGNLWRTEYYLQQMQAYEQRTGNRLLDYLTQNYYPENAKHCIHLCPAGDEATQAARLQSTRTLWDPSFISDDWIGQQYGSIRLIPRMHEWVTNYYPGTKTGITEYNFGGTESLNGALTQADVLGIFGRERLDFATMWGPPPSNSPGAYAFRMYLNYDGNGSTYGDTWISSSSSDQGQLAIYGAQRSSDQALTLMVINKTGTDLTSNLSLSGSTPSSNAQVYTYSSANLNAIVRQADQQVGPGGFSRTYPANSISLVVIPPGTGGGEVGFSTGFEDGDPLPTWTNTADSGSWPHAGVLNVGGVCCGLSGPEAKTVNENPHGGSTVLMYSGSATASYSANYAYMKVFDLSNQNIVIEPNTTLSYWVFPQSSSTFGLVSGDNSTCVAVDMIFQRPDGTMSNLRDSDAIDQHGNRAHPLYQCGKLTLDTWNYVTVNLGANSNGFKLMYIDVGYDRPYNTGGYRGYIDDISISSI